MNSTNQGGPRTGRHATDPEASIPRPTIEVGAVGLTIDDVVRLARGEARVVLASDPEYRGRLRASAKLVEERHHAGGEIYGVTTGVGASVDTRVPRELRDAMPLNLLRFHGVGTGRILDEEESAAVVAARLASLSRGYSGVREGLLERLCELLEHRLLPRIPAEGSVGASGDLTPLSYLASTLVGEREVVFRGQAMSAAEALERAGLEPFVLRPKESLAVMNGTSMMTGLACLAVERAEAVARLSASVTAVISEVIHGNPEHFDDRIFAVKPHPGSRRAAAWIRAQLRDDAPGSVARLQDRYSIRCAPHVIGVLLDALSFGRDILTVELNGVNDNPIVDAEAGEILHGGNFYGGHVCFVMDGVKTAVAGLADLLDRQLALLCVSETSDGLPDNLVAIAGDERAIHHGFKAMQITASALAAEAQKLTMPASAFSRSTESHNQDKVSMGTIAARDCLRVLELAEQTAAVVLLAACQAVDLRGADTVGSGSRALHRAVREIVEPVDVDRRQDLDLAKVLDLHRRRALPLAGSTPDEPAPPGDGDVEPSPAPPTRR